MHSSGPRLLVVSIVLALRCMFRWIIGASDAEGCEPRLHGVACTAPVAYPCWGFFEPLLWAFKDEKHLFSMRHSVSWLRCASTVHRMHPNMCFAMSKSSEVKAVSRWGALGCTRGVTSHRNVKMKRTVYRAVIAWTCFAVERDEMKSPQPQLRKEGADVPLSRDV